MSDWWNADPVTSQPPTQGAPLRVTVRPTDATPTENWWGNDPVVSTAADAWKSLGSGVARGVAGLIGLPDTVSRLGAAGIDAATQGVGKLMGMDLQRPESQGRFPLPTTEEATGVIEGVTGKLHEPQTTIGHYARTIGEFVPGMAMPGGVVGNAVRNVIAPAVVSETAGQVTKGTAAEPWARAAGALGGAGVAGIIGRPNATTQAIRRSLPPGITQQHVDDAERLIHDAAGMGVNLSWPEALSQVAGRPVLTDTLRHLEATPASAPRMAEYFGERPGQVGQAAQDQFANIAPPNLQPSTIGRAAGQAAGAELQGVRQNINAVAQPFYTRAEQVRLTPQEMAQVYALPGYHEAADQVRNNPQLARYVQGLPENSVGFLNEVKKVLDTSARNANAPMNVQRNRQVAAGLGSDAAAVRRTAVNASSDYETALAIEQAGRERFLQPLLDGPLGRLAKRDITTQRAIEAVFPSNPVPNSADEITRAVGALSARAPNVARDLVRAHAEMTFNNAARDLQSGANQAVGAKFRVAIAGNPQQAANLEAAVRALPNGDQTWTGFQRFLDVLEATGARQNIGSKTAYNQEFLRDARASNLVGEGVKATANPINAFKFLADRYERWRLGRNLDQLANVFTDPAAGNLLRAIARMPTNGERAVSTAARIAFLAAESKPVRKSSPEARND